MEPLTASTNTTRPTSETTYLANRPSRRNQILSLTPIILPLGRIRNELPRRRRFGPQPRQYGHPGPNVLAQIEGYRRGCAGVVSADPPQFGAICAFWRYCRLNNC